MIKMDRLRLVPIPLLPQRQLAEPWRTIPVSVISLADKADRRALLLERGIPETWVANYWPATDLRTATAEAVQSFADQSAALKHLGRCLGPAEVGCALSHNRAGAWLTGSDHDLMLILEDDVIPTSPSYLEAVSDVCRLLLNHARQGRSFICHLGARQEQVTNAISRTVYSRSSDKSRTSCNILLHADPIKTLWRAHAYLISKEAAKRAADRGTAIFTVADDWCGKRRAGLIDEIFFSGAAVFKQDEIIPSTVDKLQNLPHAPVNLSASQNRVRMIYRYSRRYILTAQAQLLQRFPRVVA